MRYQCESCGDEGVAVGAVQAKESTLISNDQVKHQPMPVKPTTWYCSCEAGQRMKAFDGVVNTKSVDSWD